MSEHKWMQKVSKSIKKRGTEGSFRKYCGGKVTEECIERGLNSKDPKIRKKAALAKAFMKAKHELGGEVSQNTVDFVSNLKQSFLDKITPDALANIVQSVEQAFAKDKSYDNIRMLAGDLLTNASVRKAKYGGNIKRYEEGGTPAEGMPMQGQPAPMPEQGGVPQGGMPQGGGQMPDITYEQYVQFILSYPEYFERFLQDLERAKGQMEGQAQGAGAVPEQALPQETGAPVPEEGEQEEPMT